MAKITTEQLGELIDQSNKGRITRELLQAFLENPNRFISQEGEWLTVTVDYSKSLEEMIAAGRYDWKNDDITSKNFPLNGNGKIETKLRLVRLGSDATTAEIEDHLDSLGLRPAKIEHLLAFGEKFPESQREFPIVALGSAWVYRDGRRLVSYLCRSGSWRDLDLRWGAPAYGWHGNCRFLAVSK